MSQHLFLFTIGPVQSFIAQARKTQDLYAGSKLLSELIKEAIGLTIKQGGKIIFPFVENEKALKKVESLPNRFIAEIDCEHIEESKINDFLKSVGESVEKAVKKFFADEADKIFESISGTNKNSSLYVKFSKQITQHLDIHWLFLPFTDDTYKEKFAEIEQLLGAIKNVRTFEQNEETGRKCSIDGERNALFFGRESKALYMDADAKIGVENLNMNEGLSAVSVVKRFFEKQGFPSTSEIALLDLIDTIENSNDSKAKSALQLIKKANDQFLYEENLRDETTFKKLCNDNHQKITRAYILEQHQIIKNKAKELKKDFTKYYALIAFDADSMGEWLSGSKIKNKQDLRAFHEILSQKLLEFGSWAKSYLDTPKGKAVYAGGDDFLGFVNLKHLFPVMKELRSKFDEIVNCTEVSDFINVSDRLSFSAGVVIAHYKMPLGEVLTWAKRMEDEAKELDKNKKDAFAIAVLKKSGEVIQAKSKWKNSNGYITELLEKIYNELTDEEAGFSATFIKNLNKEFSIFDSENNYFKNRSFRNGVITTEIKRLVDRSCLSKDNKKSKVEDFSNTVKELYQVRQDTEVFLEALNVCDFLTRKITQD